MGPAVRWNFKSLMCRAEENNFALDYILSQSDLAGKSNGAAEISLAPTNGIDEDDEVLI